MLYRLDEQRRKTGHIRGTKRINLGAVLDTTCSKCGGKGRTSIFNLRSMEILKKNFFHKILDVLVFFAHHFFNVEYISMMANDIYFNLHWMAYTMVMVRARVT